MASSARIDELRKKFEENPRRYFAPLANEYRKAGEIEQAIAICREYLPQQPGHMSGHIVYGQALYEARQFDEAKAVFETALSLDPENLIALRHLGDIALITGDLGGARAWYGRVLEADPRNEEIQAQLKSLEDNEPAVAARPTPIATSALPESAVQPAAGEQTSSAATVVVAAVPSHTAEKARPATTGSPTGPDSPTAEIKLDAVPAPAMPVSSVPELERLLDVPAPQPRAVGDMAPGFEPTSASSPGEGPPLTQTIELDAPVSGSRSEVPLDSASLEGLETTSIAGAKTGTPQPPESEPAAPPTASTESPRPPLTASPAAAPASADEPQPMPLPIAEFALEMPADSAAQGAAPESPSGAPPEIAEPPVQDLPLIDMSEPTGKTAPTAQSEPGPARSEPDPFVTETMAELYLQQGHRDEALRVYRALLGQRPGDPHLRAKIDQMEARSGPTIREILRQVTSRKPGVRTMPAPAAPAAVEIPPASTPASQADISTTPTPAAIEDAAAEAVPTRQAPDGSPPAPRQDRIGDLFGGAQPAAADEGAAVALALAFFERTESANGSSREPQAIPGSPARPAAKDLSLDAVFGAGDSRPPEPANFSFDQFFSQRATAEHAGTGSAATGTGQESRDDVAKFTQWLEGLKQR